MGLSIVVQCRPVFNWFVVKDCCVVGSSTIVQCRPVFNGVVVRYSSGVYTSVQVSRCAMVDRYSKGRYSVWSTKYNKGAMACTSNRCTVPSHGVWYKYGPVFN